MNTEGEAVGSGVGRKSPKESTQGFLRTQVASAAMKRPLLSLPLAVLALAAGCGGSGGDPDADPSAMVPARAPLYLEASITSDDDFEAVAKKLSGSENPNAEIKKLFDQALKEENLQWDRDFKPWVGDRLGFFVTALNPEGEDAEAALVAPTEDADKAEEFLAKQLRARSGDEAPPKISERTYKDTKYEVNTVDNSATAIIDDYAIVGTEQALKGAIDAKEGEGLADADAFKKARDQVEEDAFGFGYVRLSTLFSSLGQQGAVLRQALGQAGDTVAFSLDADEDEISVETATLGVKGEAGPSGPGSVMETLPDGSWLAAGTVDIGAVFEKQLEQVRQLGGFGGVDVDQALEQFRSQTGVDLREDVLGWMGDAGVFVAGTTLSDINGAIVVESKDAAKSEAFVGDLQRLVRRFGQGQVSVRELQAPSGVDIDRGVELRAPGVPLPISIAAAGERFVIAVGNGALEAAVSGSGKLADNAVYKDAAGKLEDGVKPQLFLDFEPVRGLLNDTGALQQAGPEGQRAGKALEQLTAIVAGGKREGDIQRGQLVVGVK